LFNEFETVADTRYRGTVNRNDRRSGISNLYTYSRYRIM